MDFKKDMDCVARMTAAASFTRQKMVHVLHNGRCYVMLVHMRTVGELLCVPDWILAGY